MNPINKLFELFNQIIFKWSRYFDEGHTEMTLTPREIAICNCFEDDIFEAIGVKRIGKYKEIIKKL